MSNSSYYVPGQTADEKSNNWKGDRVGYRALHAWVNRKKPRLGVCSECGESRRTGYHNIDGRYRRDVNDYIELCYSCHQIENRSK